MESDNPLPVAVANWAQQQARTGVRYTTAADLWQAADQAYPGLLPADPAPLSRDWPITRDLIHAYVSGLPRIEVGDRVRLTEADTGSARRGIVTAVHGPALLRVRLHGEGDGDGPEVDTGRLRVEPVPVVFYTASVITLDGSDTNAYGEACEPGTGYSEQSGWWEPDRSYWRVREHRADVTPDVYPEAEWHSPARWLADQLTARLGAIESYDHGRTFYGAHEAVHPGRLTDLVAGPTDPHPAAGHTVAAIRARIAKKGQRTLTAAGHAHGFTDDQLADAAALLGLG